VSAKEIESTAYLMGAFWVILQTSEAETLRSMMWVAPRYLRYSACLRDAVVMIGEKPESFASWRAELLRANSFLTSGIAAYLPFWPAELDPPRMKTGFPAYIPLPS